MSQKSIHRTSILAILLWVACSSSLVGCGKKAEPSANVAEGTPPADTVSAPRPEQLVPPIQYGSSTASDASERTRSLETQPQQKSADQSSSEKDNASESPSDNVLSAAPVAGAQDSTAPHKIIVPRRALRHGGH